MFVVTTPEDDLMSDKPKPQPLKDRLDALESRLAALEAAMRACQARLDAPTHVDPADLPLPTKRMPQLRIGPDFVEERPAWPGIPKVFCGPDGNGPHHSE